MSHQCVSIRGKGNTGIRCSYQAKNGSLWCGHHAKQAKPIVFVAPREVTVTVPISRETTVQRGAKEDSKIISSRLILGAWRRWLARRAGPLLWFREESNNPADFYSGDPVTDMPIQDFVSFVDGGKGYVMDIKSAQSLVAHAGTSPALNPFNRNPLPALFHKRMRLHKGKEVWTGLHGTTVAQTIGLATTDLFRTIEDLGYYTDPSWIEDLNRISLIRVYIELADIWYHRATLRSSDRSRIVPGSVRPFRVPIIEAGRQGEAALRPLVIETCHMLVSKASDRADRQLGVMYVMGALSIVSEGAAIAYPWIVEMFSPGVTRVTADGRVGVVHPMILQY
jgi:hypothetical protein